MLVTMIGMDLNPAIKRCNNCGYGMGSVYETEATKIEVRCHCCGKIQGEFDKTEAFVNCPTCANTTLKLSDGKCTTTSCGATHPLDFHREVKVTYNDRERPYIEAGPPTTVKPPGEPWTPLDPATPTEPMTPLEPSTPTEPLTPLEPSTPAPEPEPEPEEPTDPPVEEPEVQPVAAKAQRTSRKK